jgi:hypothetical protein
VCIAQVLFLVEKCKPLSVVLPPLNFTAKLSDMVEEVDMLDHAHQHFFPNMSII